MASGAYAEGVLQNQQIFHFLNKRINSKILFLLMG